MQGLRAEAEEEESGQGAKAMKHLSTTDVWHVEHEGKMYSVVRTDAWQDGWQEWVVGVVDEKGVMMRVIEDDVLRHKVVRIVQQGLMRR
jgi:hypothetical protein